MLGFYTLVGLGLSQFAFHLANEINNSPYFVKQMVYSYPSRMVYSDPVFCTRKDHYKPF